MAEIRKKVDREVIRVLGKGKYLNCVDEHGERRGYGYL